MDVHGTVCIGITWASQFMLTMTVTCNRDVERQRKTPPLGWRSAGGLTLSMSFKHFIGCVKHLSLSSVCKWWTRKHREVSLQIKKEEGEMGSSALPCYPRSFDVNSPAQQQNLSYCMIIEIHFEGNNCALKKKKYVCSRRDS